MGKPKQFRSLGGRNGHAPVFGLAWNDGVSKQPDGNAARRKVRLPMVSKAIARFARISPRKARVVVDLVRGRQAGEALQLLEFTKKSGAPVLKKLIESAVANARTTSPGVDLDSLFVETAFVDKAPNKHMRRWRPRAMGRATRIQKGMSHITIHLAAR